MSFKVENAWDVLYDSDLAVLVMDCVKTIGPSENAILKRLRELKKEGDEELPPLCLLLNKVLDNFSSFVVLLLISISLIYGIVCQKKIDFLF